MEPKISYRTLMLDVWLVLLISCQGVLLGDVSSSPKAFLEIEHIREGWESNYGSIGSMKVIYSRQLKSHSTPKEMNLTPVEFSHIERIEQGHRFHIRALASSNKGTEKRKSITETAFNGEIDMEYYPDHKRGLVKRGLSGGANDTVNALKEIMLLNVLRSKTNPEEDRPVGTRWLQNKASKVLPELEEVLGEMCHVVECNLGREVMKLWFAHNKGFIPLKLEHAINGTIQQSIVIKETAQTHTDIGPLWYPVRAETFFNLRLVGPTINEYIVEEFVPNVEVDDEMFRIEFPDGTQVKDKIIGTYYTVGVGQEDLAFLLDASFHNEQKHIDDIEQISNKNIDEQQKASKVDNNDTQGARVEAALNEIVDDNIPEAAINTRASWVWAGAILMLLGGFGIFRLHLWNRNSTGNKKRV